MQCSSRRSACLGAAASTRPRLAAALRPQLSCSRARRPVQPLRCAAYQQPGSSSGSGGSFSDRAAAFAGDAQQRLQDFVKQQQLDEKAAAAAADARAALASAYEETEQAARRAAMALDSRHNIRERLSRTWRAAGEAVRDADQATSASRRLRSAVADAQRMAPTWRRQAAQFASTQLGKATLTLLFVGLLLSGLLWQLLNVAWLVWWLSVPAGLLFASKQRSAAGGAGQQQQQQQARGGAWGGSAASSSSGGGGGAWGSNAAEGPIVEAEWESLDGDEEGQRGTGGGGAGRRRW